MDYISTSNLAARLGLDRNELFLKLQEIGYIDRVDNHWRLQKAGEKSGGKYAKTKEGAEYIIWPDNIELPNDNGVISVEYITVTEIGNHFQVSSRRMNLIMSEIGWIEKDVSGWSLTSLGKKIGGKEHESYQYGTTYVKWPKAILKNKTLLEEFEIEPSEKVEEKAPTPVKEEEKAFRDKFPAKLRTKDGHYVRSRAEIIIDNALYDYGLAHAYERKLPVEEELYSDFYLPQNNVYIEYWGLEDSHYIKRKHQKQAIYKKYNFNLIELSDDDIANVDDVLPKKLLKFKIKVY